MCITGGDFDHRRELRAKDLVVPVLTLFTLERLLHGLRVYDFSNLVCC